MEYDGLIRLKKRLSRKSREKYSAMALLDTTFDPDYIRLHHHPGLLKRFWFRLGEVQYIRYEFNGNVAKINSLGVEIWDNLKNDYVYLIAEIDMILREVDKNAISVCIWRFTRWIRNVWRG